MGCGGGLYGTVYGIGRHDGLYAYLLDLLQPALLPEIGVRLISAAKGTSAPCSESTFCVVSDHTCTNLRERLCQGDRHARGGCIVARVRRVDCEPVTDGRGQKASGIG